MLTETPATDPGFLAVALRADVVARALKMSVIVGTLLMLINHGDAIWRLEVGGWRAFRIGLTYLVPFTVSTLSSTAAIRTAFRPPATRPPQSSSGEQRGV
jgi:hypothetical protein